MRSNKVQIAEAAERLMALGKRRIGFLGFSFKAGTDDLRGSPVVEIIETILGKGYTVRLYDRNVKVARLMGANQSYIEQHIPHVAALMAETIEDVVASSDVIVIGNKAPEFAEVVDHIPPDKLVFDLVRVKRGLKSGGNYVGLAW